MKMERLNVAGAADGVTSLVNALGRGIVRGFAVAAMVAAYAVASMGSYGASAVGLTGLAGLSLATSAQPAQAHWRPYYHCHGRRWRRRCHGGGGRGRGRGRGGRR